LLAIHGNQREALGRRLFLEIEERLAVGPVPLVLGGRTILPMEGP
jgi:hypothetical protein